MSTFLKNLNKFSIQKILWIVLVSQLVVAGLTVLADVNLKWFSNEIDLEDFEPVLPGDQIRPFDIDGPIHYYTQPETQPEIDPSIEISDQLEFIVQTGNEFGEFVLVIGEFSSGDGQRFLSFLESTKKLPKTIVFHSPGGSVADALEIGQHIRENELNSAMLSTTACFSACPFAFAGGVERSVHKNSALGLHQIYYETPNLIPAIFAIDDIQVAQGEVMEHMIKMGIDPGIMVHSLKTDKNEMYILVEEELLNSRLATKIFGQKPIT